MADARNEGRPPGRRAAGSVAVLAAGLASGLVWWGVSLLYGANGYGIFGTHPFTGSVAGALTGLALAAVSVPLHRRASARALLWYSPLSVYVAIALYGACLHPIRLALGDFLPDQVPRAVSVQSVIGMWWAVTFLPHVALPVHLLAYANHRVLRKLAGTS